MYFTSQEKELIKYIRTSKAQGLKVGFTHGCYDLLHTGHLAHLQACKKIVDILIVGLESDQNIKIFKGIKRPIIEQHDRYKLVNALKPVDFTFINNLAFKEDSYARIYKDMQQSYLLYGKDFGAEKQVTERALKLRMPVRKTNIDGKSILSTTKIINRIVTLYCE